MLESSFNTDNGNKINVVYAGTTVEIKDIISGIIQGRNYDDLNELSLSNLSQDEIESTFIQVKSNIDNLRNLQSQLISDVHIIKTEKDIQKLGELLEQLDKKSEVPLFNELHKIKDYAEQELPIKYKVSKYDSERISILNAMYSLDTKYDFRVNRNSSFFGMTPHGNVGINSDNSIKINIASFRPGGYENYAILHEFLHIFLFDKGYNLELESEIEQEQSYFFHLKNLINDLIIEKLIIEKFGNTFSHESCDLGKYTSERSSDLFSLETILNILTRSMSNDINFAKYPEFKEYYDMDQIKKTIIQDLQISQENYNKILDLINQWDTMSFSELIGKVHNLITGGKLINEGCRMKFVDNNENKLFFDKISSLSNL